MQNLIIPAILLLIMAYRLRAPLGRLLFSKNVTGQPYLFDGDTVEVDGTRVRLRFIDAPENGQPLKNGTGDAGALAKAHLHQLIAGRPVTIRTYGLDIYGRSLGFVLLDGRTLNRDMVADGYAQAYRGAPLVYHWLGLKARLLGTGLWGVSGFANPYTFRKAKAALGA
jgi:endonuclease YncB( thermonuclease family)